MDAKEKADAKDEGRKAARGDGSAKIYISSDPEYDYWKSAYDAEMKKIADEEYYEGHGFK